MGFTKTLVLLYIEVMLVPRIGGSATRLIPTVMVGLALGLASAGCAGGSDSTGRDEVVESSVAPITVGKTPWGVAVTPDGSKAYVANGADGDDGTVSVLSLSKSGN